MTPPRQVLPEVHLEITQRTLGRAFRLLPHRDVSQLFLYVLGVAAQRYNIGLNGLVLMATHYHVVVYDREGNYPRFVQYLNSLVARALNSLQDESDKVWSGRGYAAVRPQSADDLVEKIVYGMANPAAAGLVNRLEDFPGLVITPDQIGAVVNVERPKFFFSPRGKMPKSVDVAFEVPEQLADLGQRKYRRLLDERLRAREAQHRSDRRRSGRTVVGTRRLRRATTRQRSVSWEARCTLRPTLAARDAVNRQVAIAQLRAFRDAYRAAHSRWTAGERGVCFPPGTWWLPRFAGARCEPPERATCRLGDRSASVP